MTVLLILILVGALIGLGTVSLFDSRTSHPAEIVVVVPEVQRRGGLGCTGILFLIFLIWIITLIVLAR